MKTATPIKAALVLFASQCAVLCSFAQEAESERPLDNFSGSVTVTNNGISTIPNLTLGEPAALLRMVAEKNGLSFEPEFRFALEGRPWAFLFWWRYDLLQRGRFRLDIGAHPAISFRPYMFEENGTSKEIMEARRFIAGETLASYRLAPRARVAFYVLASHGFEESAPDYIQYIRLNASISGVEFRPGYFVSVDPQVYHLRIDDGTGFYFTLRTSLSSSSLPLSVSWMINTPLRTDIAGGGEFQWNASLTYFFDLVD